MASRRRLALAAAFLLTACATAPAPEQPQAVEPRGDRRVSDLQRAVSDALMADPGAAPQGLVVSILTVEPVGAQLVFEARFDLPESWTRRAQEFTAYVSCDPGDTPGCAAKVVAAAGTLNRGDAATRGP